MTNQELNEIEAYAKSAVEDYHAGPLAERTILLVAEVKRLRTIIGTGQQLPLEERIEYLPDSLMAQVMAQFEGGDADA